MIEETEMKLVEETKIRSKKGGSIGVVSIILGAGGIFLSYLFIYLFLGDILVAETDAARECRLVAPFMIPAFAVVGILGGILWLVAGVGFFQKKEWAYKVGVNAVVISLFANFWPNIPTMESGVMVPGPWFLLFVPNLLVYFILVGRRGKASGKKALLGLVVGMAFILNFINGIAATTRLVNRLAEMNPTLPDFSPAFMYMLTMPTNMFASFLFGYTCVGLFISKRKDLVRITGLAGVFLGISAGFPLAFYSMFFSGSSFGFSMFILGPVVSLLVGIFILSSKTWNNING
ncbi:MAG: hypothetical protein ACXAC5_23205 [Promethearchaeota archaeon]|jgi:hypothetical protein